MIKLAIVGGRDYDDYAKFCQIVDDHIKDIGQPNHIVSGGAKGIDTFAETYAKEHNIPIIIFKPDWNLHGKAAGIIRNTDIISESTHVLALPTKSSKGTYDSIKKAKNMNKILKVVDV